MARRQESEFVAKIAQARRFWESRVGTVFNTEPRDGSGHKSVWLPRRQIEEDLSATISQLGAHVVVDGPTGTGKSSLALTELHKLGVRYVQLQVTQRMTWADFCRELVIPTQRIESNLSADFHGGIERGLPTAKFRVTLGSKWNNHEAEDLHVAAERWTEHDVARRLAQEGAILYIDDFERASEEIIGRVSDMCKLLSQSHKAPGTKLVIVGTDDICRRLFRANSSLHGRVKEISVGTLANSGESWKFLTMGFAALDLHYPGKDKYVGANETQTCIDAIFIGANGLPKSLNELGHHIARKAFGRPRVSPSDIKDSAKLMPERNLRRYKREFPRLMNRICDNPAAIALLKHMYDGGIGHIYSWDDLRVDMSMFPREQVDHALSELVDEQFLTLTGQYDDILFVSDPPMAHTFGVALKYPERFNLPSLFKPNHSQLTLAFQTRDELEIEAKGSSEGVL